MARSRDVRGTQLRIGKRFTEQMGSELHQAASALSRGDLATARRAWETFQLMYDDFERSTGIQEALDEENERRADGDAVNPDKVSISDVSTVREPNQQSEKDREARGQRASAARQDAGDARPATNTKSKAGRRKSSNKTREDEAGS